MYEKMLKVTRGLQADHEMPPHPDLGEAASGGWGEVRGAADNGGGSAT